MDRKEEIKLCIEKVSSEIKWLGHDVLTKALSISRDKTECKKDINLLEDKIKEITLKKDDLLKYLEEYFQYSSYGLHASNKEVKVMSTDKAVTEIAKKAIDIKVENEQLKNELSVLKKRRECDIQEIKNVKKMSIFEFLRYRKG